MNIFYKCFALTFLFIGTIGLAPFSHAEEYNLSYGARLTEANGAPILGQDGKLDLEVSFYNAGTGSSPIGPSPILFAGTSIAEGVFQLSITLTPTDFHQVFQDPSTPVYIEVKDVKSGAVFPRQRFSVIPFALKTPIDNDTIVYNSDGKLTVGSSVGSVKQITAGSGLTGGSITDSGTIAVDTGTTGNKIVQLSDGKLPSVDGSNLSGVNAEKLQTRNVSAAVPVSGQVLKWSGSAWVPSSDLVGETGSGEANTASNVTSGSGVGLFKGKVSADLRFYSLSPGAGVTVNLAGDDVVIASTITQYTDAMAKAAAVADSITDSVTSVAPSQNAVFDALALKSPTTHNHEAAYEPKGLSTDVVTTTKILNDAVTSAKIASGVDATKIGGGGVDNTEFGYLNGATSAIQTQLDGKVVGPASAADNAIARFDGTTGKIVKNSGVVINDLGHVGIGTTDPQSKLEVDTTGGWGLHVSRKEDVPHAPHIFFDKSRGNAATPTISQDGDALGDIFFRGHDGTVFRDSAMIRVTVDGSPTNGADMPSKMDFYTSLDGATVPDTPVKRMTIKNNGNVGIGTASPTSNLHVYGVNSLMAIDGPAGGYAMIGFQTAGVNNWVLRRAPSSADLRFFDSNNDRVTFQNGGNVGIGTINPAQKLSVAGTVESMSGGFKFPDGTTQTTASSGGIATCPTGFSMIGTAGKRGTFCIDTTQRTAALFYAAKTTCNNLSLSEGKAVLCSHDEWFEACNSGLPTGMTGDWEWVSAWTFGFGAHVAGNTGCSDLYYYDTNTTRGFRCCVR